jgi:competence protein ComEC
MIEPSKARGRVWTWPPGAAGQGARGVVLPSRLSAYLDRARELIKQWLAAELGPGRLMPWLPVAFAAGIVAYFAADREPSVIAAAGLAAGFIALAVVVRKRPVAFSVTVGLAAAAAGIAAATLRSVQVAHSILHRPAWDVTLAGWVEAREERERTDRIVILVHRIVGRRLEDPPERVRLAVRKGAAPMVGAFVELRARLNPPLAPLRPGGYDFARDLYFQSIGATGFVLGAIRPVEPPGSPPLMLRIAAGVETLRDAINQRIRTILAGDTGAIASALITGKRDAISAPVNEAMYVSSLAHVLSISGYHMALVAGVVFFLLRALLALAPTIAIRRPIKKWAALAALGAAAFYLVLSGAGVATQRAFIMTAIVLVGVLVDRPALTLRTLAVAALGVLVIAPESVVHPSFQMSFAATLALVAAYERGLPWTALMRADSSLGARLALWGGQQVLTLMTASLVAGLATTLYAAYHFHRLAPYGVLANLLAMPIVSLAVMPVGLLALLFLPFGFDGPLWLLMGLGIEWMVAVAKWVANLPGAVGRISAFGVGPLVLATAGLVVTCLLKTPLRWCGVFLVLLAVYLGGSTRKPDVLVADGAQAFAVRTDDGRLSIIRAGHDNFVVREWLAADGDPRGSDDPDLDAAWTCDKVGCIARLQDGSLVALARTAEAFEEDCRRASLVLSARAAPPGCRAKVIDRAVWQRNGALALYRAGEGFAVSAARPAGYERPWARARPSIAPYTTAPSIATPIPQPRSALPSPDVLEPGD